MIDDDVAPAPSDIRTEAESDVDYRKRLLAAQWAFRFSEPEREAIKKLSGPDLDVFGNLHSTIRIHTYIAPRQLKGLET